MTIQKTNFRQEVANAGGFAIVSAIFLLVILAALAAIVVQVSSRQQVSHASDIQGVRAYQAARAGIEWGLYNFLVNSTCAASTSTTLPGNLMGMTVTLRCVGSGSNDEVGNSVTMRRLVATACNQPSSGACPNNAPAANYVEREIAVVVGQ